MALFKKASKTPAKKTRPFPGKPVVSDGLSATIDVESSSGAAIGTCLPADFGEIHKGAFLEMNIDSNPGARGGLDLIAHLDGLSLSGVRASGLTSGSALSESPGKLFASVGMRTTFIINHMSMAVKRQSAAFQSGHDDVDLGARTGMFQLFARNAQEAADFSLIAHRMSELSLNPGMCIQEGHTTSHSVRTILMPEAELISAYLGSPDDLIDCPTESQRLLFGEKRRRIPFLYDLDRPLGIGGIQNQASYFKAVASQKPFFFDHVLPIALEAMKEFGRLTGRDYSPTSGYKIEDAEYVVVALGSVLDDLEPVVDHLRKNAKIKAGAIGLSLCSPFPGAQISELLKGKKGATVLERTYTPFGEEAPLLKEIRCALDKSTENGRDRQAVPVNPGYPTFEKISDRPQVFSGIYGLGCNNPSFSDLVAVFENMMPELEQKRFFFLGGPFIEAGVRLPGLERLQQSLKHKYAGLDKLGLKEKKSNSREQKTEASFEVRSTGDPNALRLGNLLAKAFYASKKGHLNSRPGYGPYQGVWPDILTVTHSIRDELPGIGHNATMLSSPGLDFEPVNLCPGAIVVINAGSNSEQVRRYFTEAQLRTVHEKKIDIYWVNASKIAQELAIDQVEEPDLALLALFGGFLRVYSYVDSQETDDILAYFREHLESQTESNLTTAENGIYAFRRGSEEVTILEWEIYEAIKSPKEEPEAPWTVRAARQLDETLYDPVRLWETAGFLNEINRSGEFSTDPFIATGMTPPQATRSENSRFVRSQIPQLIAENCTACGTCWTQCPASALPSTIQDITALFETALQQCQNGGTSFIQLGRMKDALLKQAYKLFEQDDLCQYLTLGKLLQDALKRLIEIAKVSEDQKQTLEREFQPIYKVVEDFPIVKTNTFFNEPNKRKRGTGLLFTLAVNADLCTQCNLCVASCPENALEMENRDTRIVAKSRRNLSYLMNLPDISQESISEFQSGNQPESRVYHLLNRKAYHSVIGPNPDSKAVGFNTAIHLFSAGVQAYIQPYVHAYVDKLADLIERLQHKIQGEVSTVVQINDFESMGEKLSILQDKEKLDLESLFEIIGHEVPQSRIDSSYLVKLAECMSNLKCLKNLYTQGANGQGRATMALETGHGFPPFWPHNPYSFPWIHQDSCSSTAAKGLFTGIMERMAKEFKSVRIASLLLDGLYEPETHDSYFRNFSWRDFNAEEKQLCPPLVIQSGFEPKLIAEILDGDLPIKILVVNSMAGEQSGEAGILGLTFRNAFVLQSSIGNPGHYLNGIFAGMAFDGPALFHIFAPDPVRSRFNPDQVSECAKLAVSSRAFPIYKYHPGTSGDFDVSLDLEGNPDIDKDWSTVRPILTEENIEESKSQIPFGFADWTARQGRYSGDFEYLQSGDSDQTMTPLYTYLNKSSEDREGLKPYIEAIDREGKTVRLAVSAKMVALTEARSEIWHILRKFAGELPGRSGPTIDKAGVATEDELSQLREKLTAEFESRLANQAKEQDGIYHAKLAQKLMSISGYSKDPERFKATLRDFAKGDRNTNGDSQ